MRSKLCWTKIIIQLLKAQRSLYEGQPTVMFVSLDIRWVSSALTLRVVGLHHCVDLCSDAQTTFNYYSTETQKQQRCSQRPWDPFLFNATRSNSRLLVKVEATKWITINNLLGGHMKNKYMNNFSETRVKTLPTANTILLLYVCECPERWGQPISSALLVFCSGPVQKHFYQTQWDKNKDAENDHFHL